MAASRRANRPLIALNEIFRNLERKIYSQFTLKFTPNLLSSRLGGIGFLEAADCAYFADF